MATTLPTKTQAEENTGFAQREAEQRTARERARQREALAAELGVQADHAAVEPLLAAGIEARTLPAVEWIPMVLVAWADGSIQPAERAAILRAARADGMPLGHPARALLESWLDAAPPANLSDTWHAYLRVLVDAGGEDALRAHATWMRETAIEVAEADGGWLGFGRMSGVEASLIDRLVDRVRQAHAA